MFVGFWVFKLNKREDFLYNLRYSYICVLFIAFLFMCSPDDDISKIS